MVVWFLLLFFAYLCFFYFSEFGRKRKSPPGPTPFPFVGTLVQIALTDQFPHLAFPKLAKKYGEVFSVKMGKHDYVIVSSAPAIAEIYSKEETLGRHLHGVIADRNGNPNFAYGMSYSEGEFWARKRAWTVRNLRDYGFGKSSAIDSITKEEIEAFLENWKSQANSSEGRGTISIRNAFTPPFARVLWRFIVGRFNEKDAAILKRLMDKTEAMIEMGTFGPGILMVAPFLKYIFPEKTGYNVLMDCMREGRQIAQNYLNEFSSSENMKQKSENFIQAYAREMSQNKNDFFDDDFQMLFLDLYQAGGETTSTYLESVMLFMILYPDVQEKIYQEIKSVIPSGQDASHEDIDNMPYTQATLLEVHRMAKVVPQLVPRRVMKDFEYKGFLIREGTGLLADLETAYHSGKLGGPDSREFRPERFLDQERGCLNELQKLVTPFSVGKRMCPAYRLAEVSSFLFLIAILQNFKLSVIPGEPKPSKIMDVSFTSRPKPFSLSAERRN